MPKHPRKRCPTTSTSTPTTQAARKGDAEIPSDLDLFFLELDALFNAHTDRQQIDSLHAQMVADMRNELARDAAVADGDSVAWMDAQHSEPVGSPLANAVETEEEEDTAATQPLRLADAVVVAAEVEFRQLTDTTVDAATQEVEKLLADRFGTCVTSDFCDAIIGFSNVSHLELNGLGAVQIGSTSSGGGMGSVVDTFGGGGGGETLDSLEHVFVDVEGLLDTFSCGIVAY
ncbi:hypothetical protein HDU77_011595 [Chytriomyces hyalinus]|nr:hypothetical protein HDU77_011595 [Chytriomyces hyalinus]